MSNIGKVIGTMPNNGSVTIVPTTSNQEKEKGYYETLTVEAVTNKIDENIIPENIKKGITILGIEGNAETGIDTSDATALSEDILNSKTAYVNGEKITGTMADNGEAIIEPSTSQQTKDKGYYKNIIVNPVTNAIDENIVSSNIKKGVSILGIDGTLEEGIDTSDATATSNDIVIDKTAYVNGEKITGTIPNNNDVTITPTTSQQVKERGLYNSITVNAVNNEIDSNIQPENIKKDISILGITGTLEEGIDTSDADAISGDLLIGKTAYVNGEKITGTMPNNGALNYEASKEIQNIPEGYTTGGTIAPTPLTQEEYNTCLELSKKILERPSDEYIQLEYLESTGTQQIDINDFTPTNDTRYEIVISNLKQETNQGIMGAATKWQQGRSILYTGTKSGKVALFWAYSTKLPHIALLNEEDFLDKHKISVYRNQLIVDDVTINDDTTNGNVPIGDTLKFFKVLHLSSSIRIHSCKLYENEELKKDIIPVRRTSDNVKCFYDLISKKYYVNQGTGDLINLQEV